MLDNTIKKVFYNYKEVKVGDILNNISGLNWKVHDIVYRENLYPAIIVTPEGSSPEGTGHVDTLNGDMMTEFENGLKYNIKVINNYGGIGAADKASVRKACYEFFVDNADTIKSNKKYSDDILNTEYQYSEDANSDKWALNLLVQLHKLGIINIRENDDELYKTIIYSIMRRGLYHADEYKPILDLYELKFKSENIPADYNPEEG